MTAVMKEGGNFKCVHGIDTDSVDEWNEHCSDPENGHTESGISQCTSCGETIVFDEIPYHPIKADGSKGIALRCDECEESYRSVFQNKKVRKVSKDEGITLKVPSSPQSSSHTAESIREGEPHPRKGRKSSGEGETEE